MLGTAGELAAGGIRVPRATRTRARRPWLRRRLDAARALRSDVNPAFYPAIVALLTLLIGSTTLLHFSYRPSGKLTWVDSLYFTTETMTTTGYGDFSFANQPTWLRLFAAALMLAGVTTTALLVSFIADVLISRRFVYAGGQPRVRHLRNHIVVVGLGTLGLRVVTDLTTAGYDVAVIERDENNRFLAAAANLDVPVIFGDATLRQTLESARVDRARAVAVLTRDEVINIETGIVLAEMLRPRVTPQDYRPSVALVLRVYDRTLGVAVARRFGFDSVRSTVELAAPWFIGAAMGLQVLQTFSVRQNSFVVGAVDIAAGSALDGVQILDLSTRTRDIAVTRLNSAVNLHPRREDRLRPGDTVYLVGAYRELLTTMRNGQPPTQPSRPEIEVSREAKTV